MAPSKYPSSPVPGRASPFAGGGRSGAKVRHGVEQSAESIENRFDRKAPRLTLQSPVRSGLKDGVGEKTKGVEKTVSIKRFPKPPANAWGGTNLSKKIVDGELKNSNSKKGRGVDETAPFTKLGGE